MEVLLPWGYIILATTVSANMYDHSYQVANGQIVNEYALTLFVILNIIKELFENNRLPQILLFLLVKLWPSLFY